MIKLPLLDCHAHIAPDVTADQLARLSPSVVFAVTRSPDEARRVASRNDQRVVWGLGAHPSHIAKGGEVDIALLRSLLPQFGLVGEIGLDRRSGHVPHQIAELRRVLEATNDEPVMLSLHSTGCIEELLELLEAQPHPGAVLHWFTGTAEQTKRAVDLGCYFSVNVAMDRDVVARVPFTRLLPETDYPATRRAGTRLPGDTASLESLIADLHDETPEQVRMQFYRNLRSLSLASGVVDRLPERIADLLLLA